MTNVINKELLSHLLKLEIDQQERVLEFVKDLLVREEMERRAQASEEDIKAGRVKTIEQFNEDFESWIKKKRASTK